MSTRSYIAKQIDDDKYKVIYCHSDGYLTYNGAMLLDHYSNKEKLDKLLALGDISYLAPNINPDPSKPHSFDYDERQDDVVLAYGRDRGEKGTEAREVNFDQLTDEDSWVEYVYIFDRENNWKYCNMNSKDIKLKDVETDLNKEYGFYGLERPKDYYGFLTSGIAEEIKADLETDNLSDEVNETPDISL